MLYLVDQPDFYVVGVVGMQGSGKSTVMSILSGQYGQAGERHLFRPQSRELRELGQHCTTGVDIYVTPERMILLDTQPVLSASVMDHMIQFEKKTPGGGDFHSLENAHMMQSLQMASFLMAVCHTVVVVQDWFADPNFLSSSAAYVDGHVSPTDGRARAIVKWPRRAELGRAAFPEFDREGCEARPASTPSKPTRVFVRAEAVRFPCVHCAAMERASLVAFYSEAVYG
ncbi:protein SMG9 [Ixodes scapularis]